MKDDLGYWLLSEDKRAVEWRATAPGPELALALVTYRRAMESQRIAAEYEKMTIANRRRRMTEKRERGSDE